MEVIVAVINYSSALTAKLKYLPLKRSVASSHGFESDSQLI